MSSATILLQNSFIRISGKPFNHHSIMKAFDSISKTILVLSSIMLILNLFEVVALNDVTVSILSSVIVLIIVVWLIRGGIKNWTT